MKPADWHLAVNALLLFWSPVVAAGPSLPPGDLALRHDIRRLADHGVIQGVVGTWPLAWGPILADIQQFEGRATLPDDVAAAVSRVVSRGEWETRVRELRYHVRLAASTESSPFRSFQDLPREEAEIGAGLGWTGGRFSIDLGGVAVRDASDGEEYRPDGSHVAVALGNWTIAASTLDRWWGPAWDSSLILSSNARPLPSLVIDRNFTDPFETRWLAWLGPWDLSIQFGEFESDRTVPDARFFGMRIEFRPLPSLEVGLSRSAQWCGDGRPCEFDTFVDLFLGRDNVGDAGIDTDNEPGNQLAGLDIRWTINAFAMPIGLYGQFIGEDEAGGFPSRYIGLVGADGSRYWRNAWSARWYLEAASTSCDFWKSEEIFDCAYNHGTYESGYRYRNRPLGHTLDNDARVVTAGAVFVGATGRSWRGHVRSAKLNRGGSFRAANSLTPLPRDLINVELMHERPLRYGRLEIGVAYDALGSNLVFSSSNDVRAFIQWRSDR